MRSPSTHHWRPFAAAAALLLFSACAADLAAPVPTTDPSRLFWELELNHHAVNLLDVAPHDTVRLVATPRTVDGEALTDLAATFTSTNVELVHVSPDGLVHVIKAGSQPVMVVAELTAGGITHADTAMISTAANDSPSALAKFSIQPTPPATATFPIGGFAHGLNARAIFDLPFLAVDQEGDTLETLAMRFSSSDPSTATVEQFTGRVTPVHRGTVSFYASTYAYGITSVDTVTYAITLPMQLLITARNWTDDNGDPITVFDVPAATIAVGGRILWSNPTSLPVDITFDDPTNVERVEELCVPPYTLFSPYMCGEGNVEPFAVGDDFIAVAARGFPVAGTYTYHSTVFGTTGKIVVVDESK